MIARTLVGAVAGAALVLAGWHLMWWHATRIARSIPR